jgi:cytochrome bd-type quinol oxidase subunit 2
MAKIKDKVQNALDEARILILGSQVLLGFQFRSAFEKGFETLPEHAQYLKLTGLGLMTLAVGLLMAPGAYHQIVEGGEDSQRVHRFATGIAEVSLLPFALGFGIDIFVAAEKLMSTTLAVVAGLLMALVALFFWYGLEAMQKAKHEPEITEKREMEKQQPKKEAGGTKIKDKIKHVLTEARVVLPGAQTLLGFQFITFLMESFDKLPDSSRYIHFASLAMVALSVVLLMTPAAYHRIVERGEETEHFHRFASRVLLAAMVPLALGLAGDFFVVTRKVSESTSFAAILAIALLVLFYGLWFGFTAYRRGERRAELAWRMDRQEAAD